MNIVDHEQNAWRREQHSEHYIGGCSLSNSYYDYTKVHLIHYTKIHMSEKLVACETFSTRTCC